MKREYSNVLGSGEPFFHPMYGRAYCHRRFCYRCLEECAFSNIRGEALENSGNSALLHDVQNNISTKQP